MSVLRLAAMLTTGTLRAGAMRSLAACIAERAPDVLALHGVDEGDALALATRFDFGWGYRGREALFWSRAYRVHAIHDRYLPVRPLRPFERRGLLCIDGEYDGVRLALSAVHFSPERERVREVPFVDAQLRATQGDALVFAAALDRRLGLQSLGFTIAAAPDDSDRLAIGLRGFAAGAATMDDGAFGTALCLDATHAGS
ncbi:MAG: hypothetical protein ACYDGM_00350 [Vulcanimicrobiaceae bacterium]